MNSRGRIVEAVFMSVREMSFIEMLLRPPLNAWTQSIILPLDVLLVRAMAPPLRPLW